MLGEAGTSVYGADRGERRDATRGGGGNNASPTVTSTTAAAESTADHHSTNGHRDIFTNVLKFLLKAVCVWMVELLLDRILEQIAK